jgi:UrcA family protein
MPLPKTLTAIIGSAAILSLLPATAATKSNSEEVKLEVSIKGYDLTRTADAQIVLYKISKAAKRVCGPINVHQPLNQRISAQDCYSDAVTRAVNSINAPQLTYAMHERFGFS